MQRRALSHRATADHGEGMAHSEASGAVAYKRSSAGERRDPFAAIPAIENDHAATVSVIVDTPKGSRNKYKWDEKLGLFKLGHVLSVGASFPYNFGFISRRDRHS